MSDASDMPQTRRLVLAGLATTSLAAACASDRDAVKHQTFMIDARPGPVAIDPRSSAVIVVDMQNDFGSAGGMFGLAGINITGIQAAIAPTARVLVRARAAGIQVIYLKMGFHADLSDLGTPDSVNRTRHMRMNVGKTVQAPDGRASRILIRDTWNTDIVPQLTPAEGDKVIYKSRFSGFYKTDLDAHLRRSGIKHLIFTGCTTSICVESTVRDAMFRDYLSILLQDCMSEPIGDGLSRSNHEASLLSVETLLGWVATSDQFLSALPA
ncbi:MAG TPA: cysteine hydrolase [Hyphomonadaceae bacterium]|nr:cysteine hydrolase [Hyphomonadaceae bacterium]